MPVFFAGYILANATIRPSYGGGFTVGRILVAGSYRITIARLTYTKFLIPVATPVAAQRVARVMQVLKDGITGNFFMDIEIRDMSNNLVDGDFTFMAIERSGP